MSFDPSIQQTISALTIHQPWAWAICEAGRNLENRDWRPPPYIAYQSIAIHSGRKWTRNEKIEASALACELHPDYEVPLGEEGYVFGSVVALARVVGFVDLDLREERGPYSFDMETSRGHVCVGGRLSRREVEEAVTSRWFRGPCAWLLSDIRCLREPIEVRGFQKLWRLPSPAALNVASQVDVS